MKVKRKALREHVLAEKMPAFYLFCKFFCPMLQFPIDKVGKRSKMHIAY